MRIPLNASTFDDSEINSAISVLKSGSVTMGSKCLLFEKQFAELLGIKNAIFVNSGSSANLLTFFALINKLCPSGLHSKNQLQPGDEVIVPAVTWSTTIWPIVQAGLVPVLVDSDPETLQMDTKKIRSSISPRTRAICPVHVLGNSVDMLHINNLAEEYGLWVIEDSCEALGTKFDNQFVGTIGDVGTFSFFFSHHITTIEGGMIVTNNDELAELLRCMRAHGWTRHLKKRHEIESKYPSIDPRFLFINTGFNLRPTELNAAFGIEQLKKLKKFNERRIEITNIWNAKFQHLSKSGVMTPMKITENTYPTWFGYPVMFRDSKLRNSIKLFLEEQGIETRPIICGNLARQPAFDGIKHRMGTQLIGADEIMDRGLFWGSHPLMISEEIDYVTSKIMEFFT